MNPAELVQGSPEWLAFRCGKFGASVAHPLVALKGEGKGRATLIRVLAAERLSGIPQGFEGDDDTDFGHEQEPLARRAFQMEHGVFLERVGCIVHPTLPYLLASPDGIVPKEYGVEFKSHRRAVKFLEMVEGKIPRAHEVQCQVGMACTGLPRWAYNNWCPQMPEGRQLVTRWIERDNKLIADIEREVQAAEHEVLAKVRQWTPQDIEALLRASLETA